MRAIVLEDHGEPEVLRLRPDVPDPVPGPDEVVVDVVATALNRADLAQRRGRYPGPPADVEIPGLEFSGRVAELGARVTEWSEGDEVMGIVSGGGYASRLVTHARQLLPVPAPVGVADAAAIPEVWITAWDALVVQGGLTSGRVALVHAGASGVGTAAIQLCQAIGARIAVTASTGKVAACRELGADLVVDYTAADFVEEVQAFTHGRGVDVVLDVVGGDYLQRNVDALATKGHIVQVGTMAGPSATFTLGGMARKRASLTGTVLRARPLEEKIATTQGFAREVLPLFDAGLVRPVIDRRFPLEEAVEAHRYMEANRNVGKIVLDVAG